MQLIMALFTAGSEEKLEYSMCTFPSHFISNSNSVKYNTPARNFLPLQFPSIVTIQK